MRRSSRIKRKAAAAMNQCHNHTGPCSSNVGIMRWRVSRLEVTSECKHLLQESLACLADFYSAHQPCTRTISAACRIFPPVAVFKTTDHPSATST